MMNTKNTWRFIDETSLDGYEQMAVDEFLFREFQNHAEKPVSGILRFFNFDRPSVTIGFFQRMQYFPSNEYPGHDVIRRITGGGLVNHDNSLTLTVITHESFHPSFSRIQSFYRIIHEIVQKGFQDLGVSLRLESAQEKSKNNFQNCFREPVRDDLLYSGKKVVGGALKRSRGFLMYQGSVFLGFNGNQNLGEFQEKIKASVQERFCKELNFDFEEKKLSKEERQGAAQLAANKYQQENWRQRI